MTTLHTPGPWHTKRDGFSTVYVEASIGGGWIQEVAACGPTEKGSEQQEANAKLVAAAPELLEALKRVVEWRDTLYATSGLSAKGAILEDFDDSLSAIAKATWSAT